MQSVEIVREFVIAGHGDLEKVKQMLAENSELLNVAYEWKENDRETAIQAAAHVGNVPIAEFLLARGAPLEIATAAMLGRKQDVENILAREPAKIRATGAHGISLMAHAALSGDVELAAMLYARGAREGISYALNNAVAKKHFAMAQWLIENTQPNLSWKNFQGKTALDVAEEQGDVALIQLLKK
ncbi:MAG: ankyrin repeat domain-containing protein [Chloroflexi bacterium]|nr:ankyrin repeat domain-containing protein [Chloroflexota bacterium]